MQRHNIERGRSTEGSREPFGVYRQCKNAFRIICAKLYSFRKPINLLPAEILQLGIRKQQFVYTSDYELANRYLEMKKWVTFL